MRNSPITSEVYSYSFLMSFHRLSLILQIFKKVIFIENSVISSYIYKCLVTIDSGMGVMKILLPSKCFIFGDSKVYSTMLKHGCMFSLHEHLHHFLSSTFPNLIFGFVTNSGTSFYLLIDTRYTRLLCPNLC